MRMQGRSAPKNHLKQWCQNFLLSLIHLIFEQYTFMLIILMLRREKFSPECGNFIQAAVLVLKTQREMFLGNMVWAFLERDGRKGTLG